jgi:hypothetical protein
MDHDRALSADSRDDPWLLFVVVAQAKLALLAVPTRPGSQCLFPALPCLSLLASGVMELVRFNGALQLRAITSTRSCRVTCRPYRSALTTWGRVWLGRPEPYWGRSSTSPCTR